MFTFVEWDGTYGEPPEGFENFDFYEQRCENEFLDEDGFEVVCNGKVWSTGGNHYYNGNYNCYTLYLHCEKCGPYEVECV